MIDKATHQHQRGVAGLQASARLARLARLAGQTGARLLGEGFAMVAGTQLRELVPAACEARFFGLWDNLEPDTELCDGGCYRFRRYGRLRADYRDDGYALTPLPHAAFRQDATYLPGYQGRQRLFAPIPPDQLSGPAIAGLVTADLAMLRGVAAADSWIIGLHMIRVIAEPGAPGLPTPEGRHRDGHDYIGMHLIGRTDCAGGESVIYRNGRPPVRMTLAERLDSLLVDDAALTHEVTPIAPAARLAARDTLLIDLNIDRDGE